MTQPQILTQQEQVERAKRGLRQLFEKVSDLQHQIMDVFDAVKALDEPESEPEPNADYLQILEADVLAAERQLAAANAKLAAEKSKIETT